MVSSMTMSTSLTVARVFLHMEGLELISMSHGDRSSLSMKSAPYNSNEPCRHTERGESNTTPETKIQEKHQEPASTHFCFFANLAEGLMFGRKTLRWLPSNLFLVH